MSYLFFKGVSDDIYDSSRHTTRPPPPLSRFTRLADPGFTLAINDLCNSSYQVTKCSTYEGIISLSIAERINAMYSFH